MVYIWPMTTGSENQAIHALSEHQGAVKVTCIHVAGHEPLLHHCTVLNFLCSVKALAWCPWQPSILASGGGTSDRHIRIWNANSGSCISALDTCSQVDSTSVCMFVLMVQAEECTPFVIPSGIIARVRTELQRVGVRPWFCS